MDVRTSSRRRGRSGAWLAMLLALFVLGAASPALAQRAVTTSLNYHANIVGSDLAAQLEPLDSDRSGLFGQRTWWLTIEEVNAARGTSYPHFEGMCTADGNDATVRALCEALSRQVPRGGTPRGGP